MQLRKMIRLLNEAKEKYGDRIEVCTDTRMSKGRPEKETYTSLNDVEAHYCIWEAEHSVNDNERLVLVLGNY